MEALNGNQYSNIADYVLNTIDQYGSKTAQVQYNSKMKIAYSDIIRKSKNFARYLVMTGLKHGDVVLIFSKNSLSYCWILLGTLYAGGTCALQSTSFKPRELAHILHINKPKWIIHSCLPEEQRTLIEQKELTSIEISDNHISFDTTENINSETASYWNGHCHSDIHETAIILSSSGSTGLPKGVMLTHNNIIWALLQRNIWFSNDATALGLMSFSHAYGLIIMLMGLCQGIEMIVMSDFQLDSFIHCISRHKISHLHLVPSLLATIGKNDLVTKEALKSVKYIWTGAGQINPKHQQNVLNKLGSHVKLYHSYGMTETTFVTYFGAYQEQKPGSCGKLIDSMKMKLISERGIVKEPRELGELCFQGPMIMKGYLNNFQATNETIKNGWLHTGDIAYFDEDGYLYIVDRIKEMIKYQGFQVSPSEIESLLLLHKGVKDVAVIGVPHPLYGELPQAIVVKNQENLSEEELIMFVKRELSSYKQLRGGVKFVDRIPKSSNGKVLRNELKKCLQCP